MSAPEKDTTAFLAILASHKGIIYKVAGAYCPDPDDRQDLIQEITAQLWKNFGRYDSTYKHSTWIYRIALNVAISMYRKAHRRNEIAGPITDQLLHLPDSEYNDQTDLRINLLQQFISGLKELDKALMLLYLDQKSHREIAGILDLSETNVATRIGRVKELLKQKFAQIKD